MRPLAPTLPRSGAAEPAAATVRLPLARWAALVALLAGELVLLMARFDTDSLRAAGEAWWAEALWRTKFFLPPLGIAIATAAVMVGGDRLRAEIARATLDARGRAHPGPYLVAHLAALALFARLTAAILEGGFATSHVRWLWIAAWVVAAATTFALWILAAVPPRALAAVWRRASALLVAGLVIGVIAWAAGLVTETWWDPLRTSTIVIAGGLIRVVASDVVADPATLVVGTSRFSVRVLSACAGYEGIGLVTVFLGAYLWLSRRELRFPAALVLLPLGIGAVWLANVLRLTTLIAIGTWVSRDVALGGFHTYSGALLFCAIALGIVVAVRRWHVFARDVADAHGAAVGAPIADVAAASRQEATAAYLLPFLATVATAMTTGMITAGPLDPLYAARVVVAGAVLATFRDHYRRLRWTASWTAVAWGAAAFVLWRWLTPAADAAGDATLAAALRQLPDGTAAAWLALRVVGAVVTVPIVEELAFRGYLLRRLADRDFERTSFRRSPWLAFAASSILFGMMHGHVLAGIAAGVAYALAARQRDELADAVVAHATTNALLVASAIATGRWSLWL